jgi:hypothetical protein
VKALPGITGSIITNTNKSKPIQPSNPAPRLRAIELKLRRDSDSEGEGRMLKANMKKVGRLTRPL